MVIIKDFDLNISVPLWLNRVQMVILLTVFQIQKTKKAEMVCLTLSQDPKEGHIGRGIQQRDEKGKRKLGEINNLGACLAIKFIVL